MKGFKVYTMCGWGYEGNNTIYTTNYNKAIQEFNNLIRESMRDNAEDLIDKEDFGQEVLSVRDFIKLDKDLGKEETEILCRVSPFIITRKGKVVKATVYHWERTSYEYQEYDIVSENIVVEEIFIG